jgi:hypothetical protein
VCSSRLVIKEHVYDEYFACQGSLGGEASSKLIVVLFIFGGLDRWQKQVHEFGTIQDWTSACRLHLASSGRLCSP